jgi:hypothetical protein
MKTIADLQTPIKALYQKAFDYLKENAFDLEKECGYQEWDEATALRVEKYLAAVVAMQDPKIAEVTPDAQAEEPVSFADPMMEMMGQTPTQTPDDLPF